MSLLALLATALLFGGMTLFSFGFAVLLFKITPQAEARRLIRASFPYYYLWVIGMAGLTALLALAVSLPVALACAAIAATTLWARQSLMGRINAATDSGDTGGFKRLHGLSVILQLLQIGLAGGALVALS